MANLNTSIEWTDATWSPVTGCTKVSTGCTHCYAERLFPRVYGNDRLPVQQADGNYVGNYRQRKFTDVKLHPDRLEQPLHWKKPRMIFVNSMSDLFHEDVPFAFIHKIFAVMALSERHTFQILTKRQERMLEYFNGHFTRHYVAKAASEFTGNLDGALGTCDNDICNKDYPLQNVWFGISCENQATADERIPILLQVPAAVRFLSCEPLLGEIDLEGAAFWSDSCGCTEPESDVSTKDCPHCLGTASVNAIDWVIVGGESGPGYRTMNLDWVRSIRDQCKSANIPFFFKQMGGSKKIEGHWGGNRLGGETFLEFPEIELSSSRSKTS